MSFKLRYLAVLCLSFAAVPARAQPPEAVEAIPLENQVPLLPIISWDELKQRIGGPTLVTLHTEKAAVREIVGLLEQQSPLPLSLWPAHQWKHWEENTPVFLSVDYQQQPFWVVVRDLAQKIPATLSYRDRDSRASLDFSPGGSYINGLMWFPGPYLVNLTTASNIRSRRLGADVGSFEGLSLSGNLYIDPRLHLNGQIALHLDRAVDDRGRSWLSPDDVQGNVSTFYLGGVMADSSIELTPPADPLVRGGTLSLRGRFHAAAARQNLHWEVPNILQAKNQETVFTSGATTYRLELQDVKQEGTIYRVTLIVSQNGPDNPNKVRLSSGEEVTVHSNVHNSLGYGAVYLTDAQNHPLRQRNSTLQREGDDQTRINTIIVDFAPQEQSYDTEKSGPPAKLVLNYHFDWHELIVPFEFKDIPLP